MWLECLTQEENVKDMGATHKEHKFVELFEKKSNQATWASFFYDTSVMDDRAEQNKLALAVLKTIGNKSRTIHVDFISQYMQFVSRLEDVAIKNEVLERLERLYRKYPHLCFSQEAQLVMLRWGEKEKDPHVLSSIHGVLAISHCNNKRKKKQYK